ncbi:MAG: site-specific DNA-methyltransferase [Baekduia sp.]
MEKLELRSTDLITDNVGKLAELFPNVVTESLDPDGNVVRAIDFDLLRQELADRVVEGPQERYQLDWPGKRAALLAANAPIAKTLRPVREESVGFDTTKNLFIEGDNLEALKLLQESYLDKVKLIFIDPPYNTGNDFLYADDFAESTAEYLKRSGQVDEQGGRLVANSESNGRFHSDWLSMMYPRLRLARNFLTSDGSIFVSCDFHESANLRALMDEVFGASNFIAEFIWQHSVQPKGYSSTVSVHHNTILCYRRSEEFALQPLARTDEHNRNYRNRDDDPRGPWRAGDVRNALPRPKLRYPLETPSGNLIAPPDNGWRWSRETMQAKIDDGEIVFNADETAITRKIYLDTVQGRAVESLWQGADVGVTRDAAREIKSLFDGKQVFDTPKPTKLIEQIMWIAGVGAGDIVMDFFAGSATTAHAMFSASAKDGEHRSFILVQVQEELASDSDAAKAGYANLAQLAQERVRRAGRSLISEDANPAWDRDIGFRVLRVDTTNFSDVFRTPQDTDQAALDLSTMSLKEDRAGEDLLFEILISWGLDLTLPVAVETIEGADVLVVDSGVLIACFADVVTTDVVTAIARRRPLRAVFRDSGFPTDADRINTEQIFTQMAPSADVRAI